MDNNHRKSEEEASNLYFRKDWLNRDANHMLIKGISTIKVKSCLSLINCWFIGESLQGREG